MSTYTDLHNKIKENITVGYSPDDRITTQQVRFYNTKNEYWGTFHGNFSAENVDVNGGVLKNLIIVDSQLSNVSYPNGVNFDIFGRQLNELSNDVVAILDQKLPSIHRQIDDEALTRLNADDNLHELITNTDFRLSSYAKLIAIDLGRDISAAEQRLTNQDNAISTLLDGQDRAISTYLNTELTSLSTYTIENLTSVSSDLNGKIVYLSGEYDQLRSDFGEEIRDRTSEDVKLLGKINSETSSRISVDTALSNEIDSLHDSTTLSLDILNADHKAKLEHDRHYVITNKVGNGAVPNEYPYQVDDYAVNLFELGNIAGRVFWNDDYGNRIEIGRVVQTHPSSSSPFPIELLPLSDIKSDAILSAFDPNLTYRYTEDTSSHRAGDNRSYELVFDTTQYSIENQLSNCSFILKPISDKYRQVTINGLGVGYVKSAVPEGESSDVLSGLLTLDTAGSTEFDVFRNIVNYSFNKNELSTAYFPTTATRVTYLGNNHFKLEKNITQQNYIPLKDIKDPSSPTAQFGMIYEKDGLGNDMVTIDGGQIKSVVVNLAAPYDTQAYKLERAEDGTYSICIAVNEGSTDNVYLSAETVNLSATFSIVTYSKQYRYNLYGLDENGIRHQIEDCYIVPGVYNKTFAAAGEDCDEIKVYIKNLLWLNEFKTMSPFTLEKAEDKLWTGVYQNDSGDCVLHIKYDGETRKLRFKTTALNGGQVVAQSYDININEPEEINSDPTVRCKTRQLDLSNFSDLIYRSDSYTAVIDSRVSGNTDRSYQFEIDTADLDIIKLRIPDRSTTDISREFIVAIKYVSTEDDKTFRKFKLVDDGTNPEVQLVNTTYGKPYLYVLPNKLAVYQVKEIFNRNFVAVDLNGEEDNYQIEQLHQKDAALSTEIDALSASLSAEVDKLSAAISSEVDTLSCSLSGEINDLSGLLSVEIDALSNKLSSEIDSLSCSLSGEINDLSGLLSVEIDALSNKLSSEIDSLSDSISATVDLSVETLEQQISATNLNLDELSADVSGHLNYKGVIPLYVKESDGHFRPVESIPDFFANANYDDGDRPFGTNTQAILKNGWVYQICDIRLAGESDRIIIPDGLTSQSYEDGDYVIVNHKGEEDFVKIEDLEPHDLEIIDTVDHQDIAVLSSEISSVSVGLSTTIDTLSGEAMTISADVNDLSAHYNKTLSTDIGLSYTYPVGTGTKTQTLSVDQLLIVDEVTFQRYRLTIRNGALNINKVDALNEA